MSTLGELSNKLERRLREFDEGDTNGGPSGDPISRNEMIAEAADYFAMLTDCFFFAQKMPAVNAQAVYRAPGLKRLVTINYCDIDGRYYALIPIKPRDMELRYSSEYKSSAPEIRPVFAIIEGLNQIRLYPAPLVPGGRTAFVEVEGYHLPSKAIASYLPATPPAKPKPVYVFREEDDCWPLPEWCEDGVIPAVAQMRYEQFPLNAEIAARAAITKPRFDHFLGELEVASKQFAPPLRFGGSRLHRYR